MTFHDLERQLIRRLNRKVQEGGISQRQLALLTGFTQPHIHNVLKGARKMHAGLADALLECLGWSIEQLAEDGPEGSDLHTPVFFRRGLVGPRRVFPDGLGESYLLFPPSFLGPYVRPILLRLDEEECGMSPLIQPRDIVLVDQAQADRLYPDFDHICALSFEGRSGLRRCRRVGGMLVLVTENGECPDAFPSEIPVTTRDILEIIKGRVVWACREFKVGTSEVSP